MSNLIDLTGEADGFAENAGGGGGVSASGTPPSPLLPEPLVPTFTPPTPTSSSSVLGRPTFMQHPLIVDQRSSYESNPFDQAQHMADTFDDPFESVHASVLQKSAERAAVVSVANLLHLDSKDDVSTAIENVSIVCELNASATNETRLSTSPRNHSDSDLSVMMKSFKSTATAAAGATNQLATSKSRSGSLDQLVRRNQLLKLSLANAQNAASGRLTSRQQASASTPMKTDAAAAPQCSTPPAAATSAAAALLAKFAQTPKSVGPMGNNNDSFDDFLAASPKWIVDSEADDSDMEQLCIPFLKDGQRNPTANESSAGDTPKSCAPKSLLNLVDNETDSASAASTAPSGAMPPLVEVPDDELGASFRLNASLTRPVTPTVLLQEDRSPERRSHDDRAHLASLLASVKKAIERFDNHSEAKAMLAGLNSALDVPETAAPKPSVSTVEPAAQIVRQGTFNLLSPAMSESGGSADQTAEHIEAAEETENENDGASGVSAEVSPNTTNIANVVEQIGRMDLSRLQNGKFEWRAKMECNRSNLCTFQASAGATSSTTYIVVMNTPAATGTKPRTLATTTPIIRLGSDGQRDASIDDEESPSSYLKTRPARSASLSSCQKPVAVARALAAKAESHSRTASGLASTSSSISARRSSFSHHHSSSTVASAPLSVPASSDTARSTRRTLSSTTHLPTTPSKRLQPPKSPSKLIRSPSKLSSASLVRPTSLAHRAAAGRLLGPPSMLRSAAAAAPSISHLKLRSAAAAASAKATGPMRATLPVRAVVAPQRTLPVATTTATAMVTPRRMSHAPAAHHSASPAVGGRALQPPSTPRSSGLPQRSSNVGYLTSATPAGKRLSSMRLPAATMVGHASTSTLARRRSMSEGKPPSSASAASAVPSTAAASGSASSASGRRVRNTLR